jgi:cellulose synthase/poly-beta-1,6-N-acetylglucosamine synthase-like glycosyltransferase
MDMTTAFWTLVSLTAVSMFGYGAAIILLAHLFGKKREPCPYPQHATVLIAAHNEESCIGEKLTNVLEQRVGNHGLRVVVVSDGSTDRTAEIVRAYGDARVSLVEIREHVGKIPAIKRALDGIGGDVVIFSDANSRLAPGALRSLLNWFGDPDVGGVCGALVISQRRSGWLGSAERWYWRYDNALKLAESQLGGAVSAQGSLYAVRRSLVGNIPESVADDFFISTQAVVAGQRLVFEPHAVAVEAVSRGTRDEFFRRVRSTERGWRGLLMRWRLLNPGRTGLYALQLLFHKVLRRMVPLMLAGILLLSILLADEHWVYALALFAQLGLYALSALVPLWAGVRRVPGASMAFFFVETQIAMAWGLARVALGQHSRSWKPARDGLKPEPGPAPKSAQTGGAPQPSSPQG